MPTRIFVSPLSFFLLASAALGQTPLGSNFTYQGQLKDTGSPAAGNFNMVFKLFDALTLGNQIGPTLTFDGAGGNPPSVNVANGLFTVPIDFGAAAFGGSKRWLSIVVNGTALTPRQELTAAPNALNAEQLDGLNSTAFLQSIPVPLTLSGTSDTHIIRGENAFTGFGASSVHGSATGATGTTNGVYGQSASTSGRGILGHATAATGSTYGVLSQSDSNSGIGVNGYAPAAFGATYGGRFQSNSTSGLGVYGTAEATSGNAFGVYGHSSSTSGRGVYGFANAASGITYGVYGAVSSVTGYAGFFEGRGYFSANVGIGTTAPKVPLHVMKASSGSGAANGNAPLIVENDGNSYVSMLAPDTNESGVLFGGPSAGSANGGVLFNSNQNADGLQFRTGGNQSRMTITGSGQVGVGTTSPTTQLQVVSTMTALRCDSPATAIQGFSTGGAGGLSGVSGQTTSTAGRAVSGWATSLNGGTNGVYGRSDSTSGRGIFGLATADSGTIYGVYGEASTAAGGFGVFALGDMGASGVKSFRIDHPDDPANKYLLHYAAESPEVINFYRGTVLLDGAGEAVVELPHYFARINKSPSYQLTAVGAPMPMLHVSGEIDEAALSNGTTAEHGEEAEPASSFRVSGGAPRGKVSWEVKAVRNDRWVQHRGAPVEVEKRGLERGIYQHPELYDQPPLVR